MISSILISFCIIINGFQKLETIKVIGSFLSCFSISGDAPSNTAQASASDTKAPEKKKAKTVGGTNHQTDKTSSGSGYNNYNYNQQSTGGQAVPAAAAPAANTGLSVRDYVLLTVNFSILFCSVYGAISFLNFSKLLLGR